MKEQLLRKGIKAVYKMMKKYGYTNTAEYEQNNNYISEFSYCSSGITIKSTKITFDNRFRVIDVENI